MNRTGPGAPAPPVTVDEPTAIVVVERPRCRSPCFGPALTGQRCCVAGLSSADSRVAVHRPASGGSRGDQAGAPANQPVVQRRPDPAHGLGHAQLAAGLRLDGAGVLLTAAVTVEDHPGRRRRGPADPGSVGSPGGVSPPGSHRTVREPLGSHRSSHLIHSNVPVHCQCGNRRRFRCTSRSHHRLTRLNGASRRYLLRAQRTR